jgi:DNA-binding response OmpR family regulator
MGEERFMLPTNATRQPPAKILVVDDDHDQANLLVQFLSQQGMVALSAYSGQECLEQVRRELIDVIVLDVSMPEMDGLEVCAALKQKLSTRAIPVILLTARGDVETRLAGVRLGVSELIMKPISGRDLLIHIETQVQTGRAARARGLDSTHN